MAEQTEIEHKLNALEQLKWLAMDFKLGEQTMKVR